jgi:hypothetical protein
MRRVPLAFGVWRLVFGVKPAAGASRFRRDVLTSGRRCAGPNVKHQTPNAKRQTCAANLLSALIFLLSACVGNANDWFFLPSPKFMAHEISFPLAGAKNTVLAPARLGENGVEFPTVAVWTAAGLNEETVRKLTARIASDWLRHVKVEWVRNSKNVVEYAVLRSDKFPVCVTVSAPEFRKQFEDVFGPKLMLVFPNRQTVFVFPALAVDLSDYSPMILEAWRSPAAKVSLEVFELSERGLKAVGRIEEQ